MLTTVLWQRASCARVTTSQLQANLRVWENVFFAQHFPQSLVIFCIFFWIMYSDRKFQHKAISTYKKKDFFAQQFPQAFIFCIFFWILYSDRKFQHKAISTFKKKIFCSAISTVFYILNFLLDFVFCSQVSAPGFFNIIKNRENRRSIIYQRSWGPGKFEILKSIPKNLRPDIKEDRDGTI